MNQRQEIKPATRGVIRTEQQQQQQKQQASATQQKWRMQMKHSQCP